MIDMSNLWKLRMQLGGAASILFVILFIVALIVEGDTPTGNDSAADIKAYFADNQDQFLIGEFLFGVAFVFFFLPFLGALRSLLRPAEGQPEMWSFLAVAAGLVGLAAGVAASAGFGALAYSERNLSNDSVVTALVDMNYYTFTTALPMLFALLFASTAIVIIRTGVLWKWLGWYSALLAIAAVISTFAVLDDDPEGPLGILGFIVLIGWGVWQLAMGAGMLRAAAGEEPKPLVQPAMA